MEEIEKALKRWLFGAERIIIVGVGNELRKDDFVGMKIVKDLKGKLNHLDKIHLIECGTVPENFIEPIAKLKPTHILIIDAALLGLNPGSMRLVNPEEIVGSTISTHKLPLSLFCEYLAKITNAKIAVLAIQPKETCFGEGLSEDLRYTVSVAVSILTRILSNV